MSVTGRGRTCRYFGLRGGWVRVIPPQLAVAPPPPPPPPPLLLLLLLLLLPLPPLVRCFKDWAPGAEAAPAGG